MPKRAHSQSVGKVVVRFLRSSALAGLVAGSAALFTPGCTDNSGNGNFMQPMADGAAGSGGDGGSGGAGGDGAGGTGGAGGDGAGGATGGAGGGGGGGGTSSGGAGGTSDGGSTD